MEDMKCSKCGGAMTMKCEETHDHGQACHMVCEACGNTVNAPAGEAAPEASSTEGEVK